MLLLISAINVVYTSTTVVSDSFIWFLLCEASFTCEMVSDIYKHFVLLIYLLYAGFYILSID